MKLSNQALGALMLALQKSLLEQSDIVPVLQGFNFEMRDGKLFVLNPPNVDVSSLLSDGEEDEEERVQKQLDLFKE